MSNESESAGSLLRALAAAPSLPAQGFRGTERYEVVRTLGAGGFGTVHEVVDRRSGEKVALKLLQRRSAEWHAELKREFRSLSDVSHPNVVRLFELEQHGEQSFFTMELLEGVTFLEWVRADASRLEPAFAALEQGVAALHSVGIVHCDLKPSNVLVTPEGRVVVLDFGLAVRAGEARVGGTPLYMAPEQLSGQSVGPAADLHALGVMLFEALVGHAPFGGDVEAVLAARRDGLLPPHLPPGDDALSVRCRRYLSADPARRGTLSVKVERFVGRALERHSLRLAFERAESARPSVVVVSGPSGIGKSTLMSQFVSELGTSAMLFVSRCFAHETVPFKLLDGLVEQLVVWLSSLPARERGALMPDDVGALISLFPACRAAFPLARPLTGADVRHRAALALRALLERAGERAPLVLVFDDIQAGDADSLPLLAEVLRRPPPRSLFVFLHREEASGDGLPVALTNLARANEASGVSAFTHLALQPLSFEESCEVALEAMPVSDRARAESIAREAGGLPFFLRPMALHGGAPDGAIEAAVESLPGSAKALLELLVVAGAPLEREAVEQVVGAPSSALAALRSERLLRTSSRGELEPYHDRIGKTLHQRLPPARRSTLHLALARVLSAREADAGFVAFHFHEGGDDAQASAHAERAGERARATFAFAAAAKHFEAAHRWGPVDESRAALLLRARADALASAGRGAEAGPLFLALAKRAPDQQLELRRAGVDQLLISGALEQGVAEFEALAASVGLSWPRTATSALAWGLGRLVVCWLRHGVLKVSARHVDERELRRAAVAASGFRGLLPVAPAQAGYFAIVELGVALRAGDLPRVSRGLAHVGSGLFGPGPAWMARIGERMVAHAEHLAQESADARLEGVIALARGACAFWNGAWRDSLAHLERAAPHFSVVSEGWLYERNLVQVMRLRCLEELGRWADAHDGAEVMLRDALERGDLYAEVTARLNQSSVALTRGDAAQSRSLAQLAVERWPLRGPATLQYVYALRARLHCDVREARAPKAWTELLEAWGPLERAMHLAARPGRVDLFLLRGRVALAHGDAKEALRCATQLTAVGRSDSVLHAQLLRAGAHALEGRVEASRDLLAAAARGYRSLDMQAYALCADARLASGGADAQLAQLRALGCRDAEGFVTLYAPGFSGQNAR